MVLPKSESKFTEAAGITGTLSDTPFPTLPNVAPAVPEPRKLKDKLVSKGFTPRLGASPPSPPNSFLDARRAAALKLERGPNLARSVKISDGPVVAGPTRRRGSFAVEINVKARLARRPGCAGRFMHVRLSLFGP